LESEQKHLNDEITNVKESISEIKKGNAQIRTSLITAFASIAVAVIAGIFSILTYVLK
jgi:ActR/RegA family two-component response regulator